MTEAFAESLSDVYEFSADDVVEDTSVFDYDHHMKAKRFDVQDLRVKNASELWFGAESFLKAMGFRSANVSLANTLNRLRVVRNGVEVHGFVDKRGRLKLMVLVPLLSGLMPESYRGFTSDVSNGYSVVTRSSIGSLKNLPILLDEVCRYIGVADEMMERCWDGPYGYNAGFFLRHPGSVFTEGLHRDRGIKPIDGVADGVARSISFVSMGEIVDDFLAPSLVAGFFSTLGVYDELNRAIGSGDFSSVEKVISYVVTFIVGTLVSLGFTSGITVMVRDHVRRVLKKKEAEEAAREAF